jgi:8-amino-7-oxononanoate synthase
MPGIVLSGSPKTFVEVEGRPVIYFGGTNYFGMSYNDNVILAAQEGLIKWGISSAGSRETTGGAQAHDLLDARLAEFLRRENIITCCSGYMINLVLLQALSKNYDVCLVDDGSHCSIKDAVAGAGMTGVVFRHADPEDLEAKLKNRRSRGERALICTDGVFASGRLAPLGAYQELAIRYDAAVVMDDAHGIGALGAQGRGTLEHLGVSNDRIYLTGTLSKAFGCFGGFTAGSEPLAGLVRQYSSAYVGSTPLPPAIAAAAIVAIDIVTGDSTLRKNLARNTELMKSGLRSLGLNIVDSPAPIATFVLGSKDHNSDIHRRLLEQNVLIPYNFYPGGPEDGFFRMVVTAKHTPEQIQLALELLGNLITG